MSTGSTSEIRSGLVALGWSIEKAAETIAKAIVAVKAGGK